MEIPKNYDSKSIEEKWYKFWLENDYFKSHPDNSQLYLPHTDN